MFYVFKVLVGLAHVPDFFDGIEVFPSLGLLVEEGCVLIPCLEPQLYGFDPPVFFFPSESLVKLNLQIGLLVYILLGDLFTFHIHLVRSKVSKGLLPLSQGGGEGLSPTF